MKLAKKTGNTIIVKDYVTLPELGIYAIGENIDFNFLNKNGYYEVLPDPEFDEITQYLGSYFLEGNKAARKVIDLTFGTLEQVKANKIQKYKEECYKKLLPTDWHFTRKIEKNIDVPQEIITEREIIRNECERIEAEINRIETIREVLTYESEAIIN